MTDVQIYLLISILIYLFFGLIFKSEKLIDAVFKYTFLLMAFGGIFLFMKSMGYIIKM